MSRTRLQEALLNGCVSLAAALVGLLSAEATLRVIRPDPRPDLLSPASEPGLYWLHPAGARIETAFPTITFADYAARRPKDIVFQKGAYVFNSLGLRESSETGPKSGPRVLCLGDSTTMGLLVRAEDAWPEQLERRLGVEVLNAGVSGHNIGQYVANARRLIPLLKPDVVVVGLYMNDAAPWPKNQRLRTWLETRSALYVAVRDAFAAAPAKPPADAAGRLAAMLDERSAAAIRKYDSFRPDFGGLLEPLATANDLRQWEAALPALGELKALAQAHGARLVAAVFPAQFQVSFGYRHPEPQRTIAKTLEKEGIPYCDMAPAFRRAAAKEPIYLYLTDFAHFNARGHELTARCLEPLVRAEPAVAKRSRQAGSSSERYTSRNSQSSPKARRTASR